MADHDLGAREPRESRRVAASLRADIEEGRYAAGAKLPSYRQLAAIHGVVPNTVGAAVRLLAAEGLVSIRPASGAYVRDREAEAPRRDVRSELTHLQDQLRAAQETISGLLEDLPRQEGLGE